MRMVAVLCVSLLLTACSGAGDAQRGEQSPSAGSDPSRAQADLPPMPPFATAALTLVGPDGEQVETPVYVADEPATRRQGLMGVEDLPPDAGMVFLSPEDRSGGFWMKNTLIPLSIAFFAGDGAVLAVLDMEPCEADPCPTYDPGVTYRGALEVNQGHFDELGVDTGWRVVLPPDLAGGAS